MDILTTLPTDSFVTAAFAELLEDVTNLLTAAQASKPLDKDEVAFWRRQLNALNKAESYYLQGVRPVTSGSAYLLASASRPGALIHRLTRIGGIVVCSCEAGQKQQLCWHHMLVNVLERAAELESLAERLSAEQGAQNDGGDTGSDPATAQTLCAQTLKNPIPHAAEAAAWLAGQQLLAQRLRVTAAYLETLRHAQQRPPIIHIGSRRAYREAA